MCVRVLFYNIIALYCKLFNGDVVNPLNQENAVKNITATVKKYAQKYVENYART